MSHIHPSHKASWGPGPWQDEPDKEQWTDESTGLKCLIRRVGRGHLCGYVAIPEPSPLIGQQYDHQIFRDIIVHGGLTWAGTIDNEPSGGLYWFGFDCSHWGDFIPGLASQREWLGQPQGTYRDIKYVREQVTSLAAQLHKLNQKLSEPLEEGIYRHNKTGTQYYVDQFHIINATNENEGQNMVLYHRFAETGFDRDFFVREELEFRLKFTKESKWVSHS